MLEIVQVGIMIIVLLLWLLAISMNDGQLKEGQYYRNYFKTVQAGLGLFLVRPQRLMFISFLNLVTFSVYFLAVTSSAMLISNVMEMKGAWFLATGIVIVMSVLLHLYIRYINKIIFAKYKTEVS